MQETSASAQRKIGNIILARGAEIYNLNHSPHFDRKLLAISIVEYNGRTSKPTESPINQSHEVCSSFVDH